jgi:hypothetical protein
VEKAKIGGLKMENWGGRGERRIYQNFVYLRKKHVMSYRFHTTVSKTGTIPIPFTHDLFNKQVEVIIIPSSKRRSTKERLMEFFEQTSDAALFGSSTEISRGNPVGKELW